MEYSVRYPYNGLGGTFLSQSGIPPKNKKTGNRNVRNVINRPITVLSEGLPAEGLNALLTV
jgi:hypothetical protein